MRFLFQYSCSPDHRLFISLSWDNRIKQILNLSLYFLGATSQLMDEARLFCSLPKVLFTSLTWHQICSRSDFFWCFVDHFFLMGIIGKTILAAYKWRQHPPLDGLPVHFVGLVPCTMVHWHWTKNFLLSSLVPNSLSYRHPEIGDVLGVYCLSWN